MNSIKLEWKRGDWAAYFGLMTNNLTNLLTMMGLLIFVVGIPTEIVYGRIAPAFGALLSLFGVIHSPAVGFAEGSSMMFVLAYLMMSGMFVLKHVLDSREAVTAPEQQPTKST